MPAALNVMPPRSLRPMRAPAASPSFCTNSTHCAGYQWVWASITRRPDWPAASMRPSKTALLAATLPIRKSRLLITMASLPLLLSCWQTPPTNRAAKSNPDGTVRRDAARACQPAQICLCRRSPACHPRPGVGRRTVRQRRAFAAVGVAVIGQLMAKQ